jgi:hypothetical protein
MVWISPLRASGVISADSTSTTVRFGEFEFEVGVRLLKFPNGGSWSFFLCPQCSRRGRKLWLLDQRPACNRCCDDRHVRYRTDPMSRRQRAEISVPKLLTRLESKTPARLHPRGGAMMDHRANLELSLRRSLLTLRRHYLRGIDKLRGRR